jgi:signal transduction histidine kinase
MGRRSSNSQIQQSMMSSQTLRSSIPRYAFAVACIALALGTALAFRRFGFLRAESPIFELAVVCVTWFAGPGPAIVAVVLALTSFDYFFVEPIYSLDVSWQLLPYFLLFSTWAIVVAAFVQVRRRIESDLRRARDHLEVEVELSQQRAKEIGILNKELEKRAEELETSNKELESFAYSVSHDLRAPLRHVAGFSELLQRHAGPSLDDKGRRYVTTILESANRMGNLIDDLLSFSRIGRAETRRTQVDLDQLGKEVVAEMRQEAEGRSINWKIHPLPVCYGDRAMLRMVIVNLVSNAVKFTRMRASAEIEIGCVELDKEWVEIFVKDNGAGFEMQYVHKLFGVFQRLHLPEQFEGTGIGLAIVQRIIVRHGGKVRAEGVVDGGATFYFSLPKTQVASAPIVT